MQITDYEGILTPEVNKLIDKQSKAKRPQMVYIDEWYILGYTETKIVVVNMDLATIKIREKLVALSYDEFCDSSTKQIKATLKGLTTYQSSGGYNLYNKSIQDYNKKMSIEPCIKTLKWKGEIQNNGINHIEKVDVIDMCRVTVAYTNINKPANCCLVKISNK